MTVRRTVVVALLLVGAFPTSSAPAATRLDPGLFATLASGSALIRTYTCNNRLYAEGSGFLVGTRVVMTARHVLVGACKVKVKLGGLWFEGKDWGFWHARKKGNSAAVDVATILLDQEAPGHVFTIRTWSMSRGAPIAMVGHPLGASQPSITQGTVLKKLTFDGIPLLANRLLVAEGSSGSPLLDAKGNVVGIAQRASLGIDLLGQLTGGVTIGIDLPSWWKNARNDLCRSYPTGGIQGCAAAPAVYHVKECWAQYIPYGANPDPAKAATTFSAAGVLKESYYYAFYVELEKAPTKSIPAVRYTLFEPNGAALLSNGIGWGTNDSGWTNFGFAFPDGSMFFTKPETTGANPWTLRWDFPDGESCSTTITIAP